MDRFAVVIVNWNSAGDTTECLASILGGEPSAIPIVVDNGSEDCSVSDITAWCTSRGIRIAIGHADELRRTAAPTADMGIILVQSAENLGFARGCNLGLEVASAFAVPMTIMLNSDTVVAPGALTRLVSHLQATPALFATLPLIRVWNEDRIWNCGGEISSLGYRRYHFADAQESETVLPAQIECSFFTGCCFAVRTHEFAARGGFTERFFFGEEDFELALWMLEHRKKAVCLTDAVVEHKVSRSFDRASRGAAQKAYVYYLNRFIHMRLRLGTLRWFAWLCAYVPYILQSTHRRSLVSGVDALRFVRRLIGDARRYDRVDRQLFLRIMSGKSW
jgi:GT2 family glycosyltransferase